MNAGSNIDFDIQLFNDGPGVATGVSLTDPLPSGPGINWSIDPSVGGWSISGSQFTGQTLTIQANPGTRVAGSFLRVCEIMGIPPTPTA